MFKKLYEMVEKSLDNALKADASPAKQRELKTRRADRRRTMKIFLFPQGLFFIMLPFIMGMHKNLLTDWGTQEALLLNTACLMLFALGGVVLYISNKL